MMYCDDPMVSDVTTIRGAVAWLVCINTWHQGDHCTGNANAIVHWPIGPVVSLLLLEVLITTLDIVCP